MIELIKQPWHWAVAGVMIGLTVPTLLLIGNKTFGISSSLRHICAACFPADIQYFMYNWKKEIWNLFFVVGVLLGGIIASQLLSNPNEFIVNENTVKDLKALGLTDFSAMMPSDIFSVENIFTLKGLIFFVIGGLMVGFGTRYAGGCTSGHAIMVLSNLQLPSLIATICFLVGGFAMTHLIMPFIFKLF
jgi:uncharacterized membrane protein YedE/YeeE